MKMSQKVSQQSSQSKSQNHSSKVRQRTNSEIQRSVELPINQLQKRSETSSQNSQKQPRLSSTSVSSHLVLVWQLVLLERRLSEKEHLSDLHYRENSLTVRAKIHQNQSSTSSRETQRVALRSRVEIVISRLSSHSEVKYSTPNRHE